MKKLVLASRLISSGTSAMMKFKKLFHTVLFPLLLWVAGTFPPTCHGQFDLYLIEESGLGEFSFKPFELPSTNKGILMEFWAAWCTPCIVGIPKWNDKNDSLVGLVDDFYFVTKDTLNYRKILTRYDIKGKVIYDRNGLLYEYCDITGLPSHVLFFGDKMQKFPARFNAGDFYSIKMNNQFASPMDFLRQFPDGGPTSGGDDPLYTLFESVNKPEYLRIIRKTIFPDGYTAGISQDGMSIVNFTFKEVISYLKNVLTHRRIIDHTGLGNISYDLILKNEHPTLSDVLKDEALRLFLTVTRTKLIEKDSVVRCVSFILDKNKYVIGQQMGFSPGTYLLSLCEMAEKLEILGDNMFIENNFSDDELYNVTGIDLFNYNTYANLLQLLDSLNIRFTERMATIRFFHLYPVTN